MSMTPEIAAYCLGKLGPGEIEKYSGFVRKSGLTVPILGFLHIGRPDIGQSYGDLIYNGYEDGLLVSNGQVNPRNRPEITARALLSDRPMPMPRSAGR